jgi:hypothetical protein
MKWIILLNSTPTFILGEQLDKFSSTDAGLIAKGKEDEGRQG